jgi:hypothetical protein
VPEAAMTAPRTFGPDSDAPLVVEQRFAIVPEWVIDAEISDSAFRLYSVLLRYGQSSGARMPSRATLARRLKKRSVDSVDRAMRYRRYRRCRGGAPPARRTELDQPVHRCDDRARPPFLGTCR